MHRVPETARSRASRQGARASPGAGPESSMLSIADLQTALEHKIGVARRTLRRPDESDIAQIVSTQRQTAMHHAVAPGRHHQFPAPLGDGMPAAPLAATHQAAPAPTAVREAPSQEALQQEAALTAGLRAEMGAIRRELEGVRRQVARFSLAELDAASALAGKQGELLGLANAKVARIRGIVQ
ncbi:hypothetical protein SS50377_22957 [Spironucleus salmonicida]|uniref:Uncharacterized protein n=1 Tax=Spironucleus salmonicida TaxID=348837 RepID=A0A9P8LVU2_9EUKA|nr:hypothetical protein SS50377_22946 [Spironucleus salmonicida]KAH0575328.1 hypothetical protein SS50377_22957 [Spironucleus salmonicida]